MTSIAGLFAAPRTELLARATALGVDLRPHLAQDELVAALVTAMLERGDRVHADGVLSVLPEGFGFLRLPANDYAPSAVDAYLSPSQVRRSILIPQSLTAMLPTLVSQVIVITKDTALGYIILYPELLTRGRNIGSSESATLPAYVVGAVMFILLNYALSKLAEWIETRQRRRHRTAAPVSHAEANLELGGGAAPGGPPEASAQSAGSDRR